MQDRLIVSPAMYRKMLEPRLAKFIQFLKSKTRAKLVHHTDGAVTSILDSLADMGIDAINPVQVSAKGMEDTAALKKRFGDRLAFWGGVDTQRVLPFGTPEDVRVETQRRITDLNAEGGYVLCSAHNIQSDVPAENIIAMYEVATGAKLSRPQNANGQR
jgi:uroporphyrinogen decarboxylase